MAVEKHRNRWRAIIYDRTGRKKLARSPTFDFKSEAQAWERKEKARRLLSHEEQHRLDMEQLTQHTRFIPRPDFMTRLKIRPALVERPDLSSKTTFPVVPPEYRTQPPNSMLIYVPEPEPEPEERVERKPKSDVTLREALEQYRDRVVPTHRAVATEQNKVNVCLRAGFVNQRIVDLTKKHFNDYLDNRLTGNGALPKVAAATAWMEVKVFRRVIEYAKDKMDVEIPENVAAKVRAPRGFDVKRTRRLLPGEEEKLLNGFHEGEEFIAGAYPLLRDIIVVAIDTAMRQDEIVHIDPSWFREFGSKRAHLEIPQSVTKTDAPRSVPVSRRVEELLTARTDKGRVFPVLAKSISKQFIILRDRLKIDDLRFHDLRHEGVSRLGSLFPTLDVMKISGHRSLPNALRYHHPDIGAISERLRS